VSTAAPGSTPYRVVYSERVRQRLLGMADMARERGDGEAFLAALKEFHRRLCVYPQFGEPLLDLTQESGQVWIGTVRPLAMRYGRTNFVSAASASACQAHRGLHPFPFPTAWAKARERFRCQNSS